MKKIIAATTATLFMFYGYLTTASETTAGFKQDMATFKTEMSAKLESAEAQLTALKEKAKVKGSNVKQETIVDLEKTKAKIKTDLDALDKSTEKNWKTTWKILILKPKKHLLSKVLRLGA
jgi:hypothetical protein